MMEMEILLPEGEQVEARFRGSTLVVGKDEGEGSLEPLDLFFASIGLCAGKYVMEFCRFRAISFAGAKVLLRTQWDEQEKRHTRVRLEIQLPPGFPAKYERAVLRAVDQCSVKMHIMNPPHFEMEAVRHPAQP